MNKSAAALTNKDAVRVDVHGLVSRATLLWEIQPKVQALNSAPWPENIFRKKTTVR